MDVELQILKHLKRSPNFRLLGGEHVKYVNINELKYEKQLATTDELSTQFKCSYKTDMLPLSID